MKGVNIEHKLQNRRDKKWDSGQILAEVQQILSEDFKKEEQVTHQLGSKNNVSANDFDFDQLETEKIFHIDQIKEICIDYRLRFLNSSYFKGEIPQEAISKIKQLEAAHNTKLEGFRIMAPSKLFKLEDKDDPLLFAPIGNDYYYLIHKWGNDLHPLRKLFAWPFKNIANLVVVVLLISYLVTLMVPEGLFSKKSTTAEFWIIYFFMFKCIASIVIFYGFALGKNFNPAIWKSKYFNA
ncbi:hypothetical protein [Flagellimonas halotolerans]|uniref:Uncharacterized protein n=1 Tax=Flagellimonas halotolerans TaxID=3112164 RepID=A0ABU6ITR4_9FLAO|nr:MULTISPECIES: hypothetical protein [unclassified Allomuricauda]MEC3966563.1 hypothetical protein [Muricauda sp. SYSU M86414]MEC4266464.1 hypothetical protein [Muricauda sp. SYSU M84420]